MREDPSAAARKQRLDADLDSLTTTSFTLPKPNLTTSEKSTKQAKKTLAKEPAAATAQPVPVFKTEEWQEVEVVIEDQGPEYAGTVESNMLPLSDSMHVPVETTLLWPNAASAGTPLGQNPYYVVKFTEEKKARVISPLYLCERVHRG